MRDIYRICICVSGEGPLVGVMGICRECGRI